MRHEHGVSRALTPPAQGQPSCQVASRVEAHDTSTFVSFTVAFADRELEHKEGDPMDTTSLAQNVVDETTIVVDNIASDQLGNPTPCAEWTVHDVLDHITNGAVMFAMSADQGSVSEELMAQIAGGDDYKVAWRAATTAALTAAAKPGAMEKTVTLPFGEMTVGAFLNYVIFDLTTHATDLARATGQTITNTDLLEAALEVGRQTVGPGMRQPGVFDSEQFVSPDAPIIDRLQAFAGRRL